MDKVEVDIADKQADHTTDVMADADVADDVVEDEVRLHKQHNTTTYRRSGDRSPRYSVEEQAYSMPRTLSNGTIIGTIVSRAAST